MFQPSGIAITSCLSLIVHDLVCTHCTGSCRPCCSFHNCQVFLHCRPDSFLCCSLSSWTVHFWHLLSLPFQPSLLWPPWCYSPFQTCRRFSSFLLSVFQRLGPRLRAQRLGHLQLGARPLSAAPKNSNGLRVVKTKKGKIEAWQAFQILSCARWCISKCFQLCLVRLTFPANLVKRTGMLDTHDDIEDTGLDDVGL